MTRPEWLPVEFYADFDRLLEEMLGGTRSTEAVELCAVATILLARWQAAVKRMRERCSPETWHTAPMFSTANVLWDAAMATGNAAVTVAGRETRH